MGNPATRTRPSKARKVVYILLAILFVLLWLGSSIARQRADAHFNRVQRADFERPPWSTGHAWERRHDQAFVADLHADSLLWGRDLLDRGATGHVDVPRLRDGGVSLQVFGLVTKTPKGMNFERNSADTDALVPLVILGGWPPWTWTSPYRRARYQLHRLDRFVARSDGELVWIRTVEDLDALVALEGIEPRIGALAGLEGAHAVPDVEGLRALYDDGLRMLGLAHFFDNHIAGSAHGVDKHGLTDLGREVVAEADRIGMVIDLAHASPRTCDQVIARATRPVVVSHGGVQATCPGPRNLSDAQLRALAGTGGVLGVGYFRGAVCGSDLDAIVRAIVHAVRVAGPDHVALGSDFDGAITAPMDAADLRKLTVALYAAGLSDETVRKVLGENVVRVLRSTLPSAAETSEAGGEG